jgi:hypothetical protein
VPIVGPSVLSLPVQVVRIAGVREELCPFSLRAEVAYKQCRNCLGRNAFLDHEA